jgi:hypothetical protein
MNTAVDTAVKTWQTTLAGLIAGGLTYANQIGASYPKTKQEWAAAGMAAAMLWLGTKAQQTK